MYPFDSDGGTIIPQVGVVDPIEKKCINQVDTPPSEWVHLKLMVNCFPKLKSSVLGLNQN